MTVLFISLGIFLILLALFIVTVILQMRITKKEFSLGSGFYGGPAGEPLWDGVLPQKVDDYVEPRYVYENLVESTKYLPENGRIIGYRISPSLVIHSRVCDSVNEIAIYRYLDRYGGRLLETTEAAILLENLQAISDLRIKAGDEPLKLKKFWISNKGCAFIAQSNGHLLFWEIPLDSQALLVLKR